MRAIVFGGLLLLAGCVATSRPAVVGMSVGEYMDTCAVSDAVLRDMGPFRVGDCTDKPDEFATFQEGRVSSVQSGAVFQEAIVDAVCSPTDGECRADIVQAFAEMQVKRRKQGQRARSAAEAEIFDRIGAAGRAMSEAGTSQQSGFSGGGVTCFSKGSYAGGFNKVCNYDCLGSPAAITIGSTELCPLTIEH